MKRSRFSEEKIISILREADGESTVKAVCAKHNISDATFYNWKRKYGGMEVDEARRLRALEAERTAGAGFGIGFSRSFTEYSNRAFPVGLLIGEKFFTLGVCVFVYGRTVLVPRAVLEEIAQGRTEQGGEPAVFEHFGVCSFREVSREHDLVLIEIEPPDESFREQMVEKLG